ncbi:hypothetical protein K466DRAFT_606583 [Polyporus arcularius HHB13444]|uniref:Uncharacterized protein n=1 Tax=Polyporus arcularius HHB13444 TaxID=1314778 RepID=A0A5C3NMG0_9APHY|nr:hypothetical protein K466DRAFT_606583 [Polyporus arcularius HHB13444]
MSLFKQYPISDARSEPVPERRPSPLPSRPPPPPTASSTTASPAAAPYEYSPGCMSDGTMSANHWAVQLFVKRIGHAVEEAEAEHAAQPENAPWHVMTGHRVSWWRAEKAGILQAGDRWTACRTHVEHLLADLGPGKWSLDIFKAIFVLGALSALPFPGYAAFWAFWGTNSAGTTADLVNEVVTRPRQVSADPTHRRAEPKPALITEPMNVSWIDKDYGMWAVRGYRDGWLPTVPHPNERRAKKQGADGDAGIMCGRTRAREPSGLLDAGVPFGNGQA